MTELTSQQSSESPPDNTQPAPGRFKRKRAGRSPVSEPVEHRPQPDSRRRAVRITPTTESELNWRQRLTRTVLSCLGAGFGFSMLVHFAVIFVLGFWILDIESLVPEYITNGWAETVGIEEVEVDTELPIDLAMKKSEGELQQAEVFLPSEFVPPSDIDTQIPADLETRINQLAQKDTAKKKQKNIKPEDLNDAKDSVPKGGAAVGKNAVSKGKFTVWSIPRNPAVNQSYRIAIRVELPDDTKRYQVTDLSGTVVGDDAHRQQIPHDNTWGPAKVYRRGRFINLSRKAFVPVVLRKGKKYSVIYIWVPGSRIAKTIDTVKIRSTILKEEQTLKIVF